MGALPLDYAGPTEQRYHIRVMGRYLDDRLLGDKRERDDQNRIFINHINLAVHYPSLTPAEPVYGTGDHFIALSIVNTPPGDIRRSLDGSWLNGFSKYKKPGEGAYGLNKRLSGDYPYDGDFVLFRLGPSYDVRIECHSNANRPVGPCTMIGQWRGEPGIETSFEQVDLPDWSERLRRLRSLFRIDGRGPCGAPCRPN